MRLANNMGDPYRSPTRPVLPYVVLDQNCLRDESIVAAALERAKQHGERVVLIEATFFEIMKSKEWESYYDLSLKHLAAHSESVVGCRSLGEMMEVEARTGVPQWEIVDPRWTSILRKHLLDLDLGLVPDKIGEPSREFATRLHEGMFTEARYERLKAVILGLVKIMTDHMPPEQVNKLRRGDREAMIEFLSSDVATRLCVTSIEGDDCPHSTAILLAHEPSATFHDFMCTMALTLKWVAQGGVELVKPERLNNDSLDMYYVAIALYCSDLKSKDRKMDWIYGVLREALDRRWVVNRTRFESLGML